MNHYYTQSPDVKSIVKEIPFECEGVNIKLKTDLGVFSKDKVDYGSEVFLKTLIRGDYITSGKVLDLGAGYGTIGVTLMKRYLDVSVTMVELNERAVGLCNDNVVLNEVVERGVVVASDVLEFSGEGFDYVVTNPPIRQGKKVVHSFFEKAYECLEIGGAVFTVLQRKQGAPSAFKKMKELFGNCEIVNIKSGYHILKSVKGG